MNCDGDGDSQEFHRPVSNFPNTPAHFIPNEISVHAYWLDS